MPTTRFEVPAEGEALRFFQGVPDDFRSVLKDGLATLAALSPQDYGGLVQTVVDAMASRQGNINDDRIAQIKVAREKKTALLSAASVLTIAARGASPTDTPEALVRSAQEAELVSEPNSARVLDFVLRVQQSGVMEQEGRPV